MLDIGQTILSSSDSVRGTCPTRLETSQVAAYLYTPPQTNKISKQNGGSKCFALFSAVWEKSINDHIPIT